MSSKPWWRDWRGMPPSVQNRHIEPLSRQRVWVTRVSFLVQAGVVLFAAVRFSWIWIIFAAGAALNLAAQPDMHRRQILGRSVDDP